MYRVLIFALALSMPSFAFAAGGGSQETKPPKPSPTTTQCKGNKVWDERRGRCVRMRGSELDDDTLYGAVRELAYAGEYERATEALEAMSDPEDDRVLTYLGFIARKTGDMDMAMVHYRRALEKNPDNILARSYMGQGLVVAGDRDAASVQLTEIVARGGQGTWAETSLRAALETGATYDY